VSFPTRIGFRYTHDTLGFSSTFAAFLPNGSSATGTLLLAHVTCGPVGAPGFTWPSGWTEIGTGDEENAVRYHVVDGTEGFDGTDDSITLDAGAPDTPEWASSIVSYAPGNWHGTSPPEAASASGSSTTPDPPSLDPAGWGTEDTGWLVFLGVDSGNEATSDGPDGYTTDHSDNTGGSSGVLHAAAYLDSASASQDPTTFTIGSIQGWRAYTVAVRPATAYDPAMLAGNFTTPELHPAWRPLMFMQPMTEHEYIGPPIENPPPPPPEDIRVWRGAP